MAKPLKVRKYKGYSLSPGGLRKIHREYHDIDYLHKLSPAEREWIGRFMDEYYQSAFCNDGKDHYPPASIDPPEWGPERQEIIRESNARRRCIHGKVREKGFFQYERMENGKKVQISIPARGMSLQDITYVGSEGGPLALEEAYACVDYSGPETVEDLLIEVLDGQKEDGRLAPGTGRELQSAHNIQEVRLRLQAAGDGDKGPKGRPGKVRVPVEPGAGHPGGDEPAHTVPMVSDGMQLEAKRKRPRDLEGKRRRKS